MSTLSHSIQILAVLLIATSFLLTLFSLLYFNLVTIKLVCLEVLAHLLISALSLWSLFIGQPLIINVCMAIALIMFLSTVAYCQLIMHKEEQDA